MKSMIARISYKMLVTTMITILLSFFVVTSCSHANKFSDLVNDKGIYYSGTQDAKVTVQNGIFSKIIQLLSTIASYILGIIGLGIRGVFIGWIEIAEMLLVAILDVDGTLEKVNDDAMDNYSQNIVNVESILFNRVPILNANIFDSLNPDPEDKVEKIEQDTKTQKKNNKVVRAVKNGVAKWYYILRLVAIIFMLLLLIFVGIKMAISTIASEKAIYKQMLVDWVVGMIIVFSIHYVMILIFNLNDSVVEGLEPLLSEKSSIQLEEFQYGIENEETTYDELETTLYESARTRAYSLSLTDGFTGMVIYGVLVYYAWRFAIMYFIRVFNIMILTLIAPIIATSYAVNKVLTGKSKIFSSWLLEYIINVIIQIFHVIIYVSFVSIALKLSLESLPGVMLAFVMLHVMLEAEKVLRTIFKMSGAKGSLSGTMESTGFSEIKSGIQGLGTAMLGGKLGKTALKATYRVATKPGRALVETTFGNYMAKKANELQEEEEQKIKDQQRLEEAKSDLEESIERLKQREQEVRQKEAEAKQRRGVYGWVGDEEGQEEEKELEKIAKERTEIEKQLADYQEKLNDTTEELEFMNELNKIENLEKAFRKGTFKGSLENLFDPMQYVEKGKDGKYHRMKTRRKGGAKGAWWREKKDSIGMRFMDNAKMAKMLNLSSDEVKELKKQFKISKSNVLGFMSAAIGFPAFVVEPTLGIALLGQAMYSGLGVATKVRQIKNRPSYKKNKRYNFISFNKAAQYTMQVEAARQIKEIRHERTQELKGKHFKFVKNLLHNKIKAISIPDLDPIASEQLAELSYTKYTKQFKTALKQFNELDTTMTAYEFKKKFEEQQKNQKDKAEGMSKEQLLWEEYVNQDGIIEVGDALYEIGIDNDAMQVQNRFVAEAEHQMDAKPGQTREERINAIKSKLNMNKNMLIQSQIEKYFAKRGIIDINSAGMSESDKKQIKQNVLSLLEETGIVRKGEIKLEDNLLTNENIEDVYSNLQADREKTNESLEQRIATDAVLEYMQETGITKKSELLQKTEEIFNIIKDKLMSEDSKKSADVIRKISGQDKSRDEIELSDYMKDTVEDDIKKIKKVNLLNNSKDREKLIEHQTNRNINRTKNSLEQALCADTLDNINDEGTLELLFALSKIGSNNREAVEVHGKKKTETKKEQLETLEFYQDGGRKIDSSKDGSRRFDETKDGSQRLSERYFVESKKKALEKRLFGPEQNVIDLINNV